MYVVMRLSDVILAAMMTSIDIH
ncbi:uncharacterized protein METZ01_LOCUS363336 [marine metagenome]|uniref:Uncharacterized protein n=1 Tax=marine metagenome TaxID=408172 RepID=A0A382SLQ3_9ZZZZ